jgi:hypothetical protein
MDHRQLNYRLMVCAMDSSFSFWDTVQCARKCGSNFYTKCHKMALLKSQICSILQHSILDFFQKNMLRRFSEQFLPPICALKFVEMLLEGFSYTLSIMMVN